MTERVMLGVGKALAEARQAQGLGLADVALQLKFMPRQLEALEAERFESLPGPTIARGMVRTYARFLKLEPEPLLQSMSGHVDAPDATPNLAARFKQPVPFSNSGRRSTVLYLALSAVVLGIAVAMVYEWRHERFAPLLASAGKTAPEPAAEPAAEAAPASRPQIASASPLRPPSPVAEPVSIPAAPLPSAPTPKAVAPKTVAKEGVEPKVSSGPNRIVLRFEEAAWAEVTDALGRQLVSSLNPAGTERVVRGVPPFNLVIGNAQHVKVSYNNRDIDLQPHVKVEVARFTLK